VPQILYFYRNHLSPRISEQVPHYGGAYALAAEWGAWCRQHARTDPIEAGTSLLQMMRDLRAMPQPARDAMLDYYLVNSAKFGMKRMVWRGEPKLVRAALAELAALLQTCGYGRSIVRRMADLRASLWMLRIKHWLGWQRTRGGLGLPAYLEATETNPDMLKPACAAALAARQKHQRRRQKRSLKVDFYDMDYRIPGSATAHARAREERYTPPRAVAVRQVDDDMATATRKTTRKGIRSATRKATKKMLPLISLSQEEPEAIFYCTLYPEHQQHFHHLTRKVFVGRDNILPDWRSADWGMSFDAPSERNFHTNWVEEGHPGPAELLEIAPPPPSPADILAKKSRFCAFVYLEPYCASRLHFLELLSRTMRVEAAGQALRSVPQSPGPRHGKDFLKDLGRFYRPYKFVISFENVRVAGFNGEKIWTAFLGDAVPIYLGDPNIATEYNPEAFIHARDFDSLESLAAHVMRVHNDDALYLRYLSQPRFTEEQRARWQTYPEDSAAFLRKALLSRPVGAYAPLAQRDNFLRESISRLESKISTRFLDAPHREFRPTRAFTPRQMRRVWRGETP